MRAIFGVRRSLLDVVPREHRDPPAALRRRRIATVATLAVGAVVLGVSLRLDADSPWFYPATLLLALVWTLGAFAAGPLHLGRIARARPGAGGRTPRPVLEPLLLGLLLVGVFLAGSLVVKAIPPLADQVDRVLGYADAGSLPLLVVITVVNGVAEELFFRGAAYAAITRQPVAWTTVAYTLATAATGNLMLAFAAAFLGVVVGLQRRASGGVLAPILTHCTWSLGMLLALPLVL